MAATPDQRDEFRARLKSLRAARDLTQPEVVELLERNGGYSVTPQAYGQWENGKGAPDRQNAVALARIFGEPDYALAELLGYRGDDPTTAARLDAITEELSQLRSMVADVVRRLDRDDR